MADPGKAHLGRGLEAISLNHPQPAPGPPEDLSERLPLGGRILLFLSSYAPLFGILAIRFSAAGQRYVCLALASIGVAYLGGVALVARRAEPRPYEVQSVSDAGGEVAGYLASYLLPFVTVATPTLADTLGYALYGLVTLGIFVRSDLIRINPTLYLMGRRIICVTLVGGEERYMVCRRVPRPPREIGAIDVGGLLVRR